MKKSLLTSAKRIVAGSIIVGLTLWVIGNSVAASEVQTKKTLSNEDIVSLVKAGLSDPAIISLIERSNAQFDLGPDALVILKKSGVSNSVIEAMLGNHPVAPKTGEALLIPSAYGYYVIEDGKLLRIDPVPVTTIMGLQAGGPQTGNPGIAVDGFRDDPSIKLTSQTPTFFIYQQDINAADFHLYDLTYVETMQAYQFNMNKTNPAFFRNVYGRNYYDVLQIDLWRPHNNISVRIGPVDGKPGMYKFIPEQSLTPGKYALFSGDSVHPDNIIFATSPRRTSTAFYFEIQSAPPERTSGFSSPETKVSAGNDANEICPIKTLCQIAGGVTDIDTSSKTITVKGNNIEVSMSYDDKTKFHGTNNFEDIKVGNNVVATYTRKMVRGIVERVAMQIDLK